MLLRHCLKNSLLKKSNITEEICLLHEEATVPPSLGAFWYFYKRTPGSW